MSDLTDEQLEILRKLFAPKPEGELIRHDFYTEPEEPEIDWRKLIEDQMKKYEASRRARNNR